MVRVTPCISLVIQRKAVRNQKLLEKWIQEDDKVTSTYAKTSTAITSK